MGFLDPLSKTDKRQRPKFFIYMSCFPDSLAYDIERLQSYGYDTKNLTIIDQFPQTKHYEVLALLQRK
jgi:23S rRNA (uracil1939-C5)-methyltransferase